MFNSKGNLSLFGVCRSELSIVNDMDELSIVVKEWLLIMMIKEVIYIFFRKRRTNNYG